jgi:Fe-S-cluster containining protein
MKYIPWSKVSDWYCRTCGKCCKIFKVPLSFIEVNLLSKKFGFYCIEAYAGSFYLKRINGKCIFQFNNLCSIHPFKPMACKLWPFSINEIPKYGEKDSSYFEYKGEVFYVYLNSYCEGIVPGKPSFRLVNKTIPELIELIRKPSKLYSNWEKPSLRVFSFHIN